MNPPEFEDLVERTISSLWTPVHRPGTWMKCMNLSRSTKKIFLVIGCSDIRCRTNLLVFLLNKTKWCQSVSWMVFWTFLSHLLPGFSKRWTKPRKWFTWWKYVFLQLNYLSTGVLWFFVLQVFPSMWHSEPQGVWWWLDMQVSLFVITAEIETICIFLICTW